MSSYWQETAMVEVGPGNVTGLYYITLCSLPFNITWHDLKDYASKVCDVEHAVVFRDSTSGWVRVSGKKDFEAAWKHLNGGNYKGRAIIASDRNAKESIVIRVVIDKDPLFRSGGSWQMTSSQAADVLLNYDDTQPITSSQTADVELDYDDPQQVTSSRAANVTIDYDDSHTGSSSSGQQGNYMTSQGYWYQGYWYLQQPGPDQYSYTPSYPWPSANMSNAAQPMTQSFAMSDPDVAARKRLAYADPSAFGVPVSGSAQNDTTNQGNSYAGNSYAGNPYTGNPYAGNQAPSNPAPAATESVELLARKIVITGIERKSKRNEVESWLRHKLQKDASEIVDIEIPRTSSKSELRGQAYVVFKSENAAIRAVKTLHDYKYQRRKLVARLTNEGEVPFVGSEPVIADGSSRPKHDKPKRRER